jgi:hypothetical protein
MSEKITNLSKFIPKGELGRLFQQARALNPALALPGQGLKKSPIGQKLDFANHPYLCKGLFKSILITTFSHR